MKPARTTRPARRQPNYERKRGPGASIFRAWWSHDGTSSLSPTLW